MNGSGSPLLSVRAEARQLVAPDYGVVDGLIEHTARSKAEAVRSVAGSLDRLTADLAALGAVPFDAGAGRRPLTWSAYSSATREELYHDKQTMRMERTGLVTATVALRVTVRDLESANPVDRLPVLGDESVLDAEEVEGREVGRTAAGVDGAIPDASGGEPAVLGDDVRLEGASVGHSAAADGYCAGEGGTTVRCPARVLDVAFGDHVGAVRAPGRDHAVP
jgi:hypothetical protein